MLQIAPMLAWYLQLKSQKDKYSAKDKGHVEPIDDPKPGVVKGPLPSLTTGRL